MKRLFLNRFLSTLAVAGCLLVTQSVQGASTNLVLRTRTITWQAGISAQLSNQLNLAAPAGKPVPAFVMFTNSLSLSNHQLLQSSGVRLEEYLRDDSYAALLPSATFLTNSSVLALVFAAAHWLPSDKIQVAATTNQLPFWAYKPQSNTMNLLVGFWRSIDQSTVTNDLASVGLTGLRYGADNSWAVVVPVLPLTNFAQILTNLASLLSVRSIQPGPLPYFPLNETGRLSAKTDDAQGFVPSTGNYGKVSGNAVRIAICDNGIDPGHHDFSPASRFYQPATAGTAPGGIPGNHATHVGSVALGNGADSPSRARRGHAPLAKIGNYYTNFGANVDLFYKALALDGADVSNHSYVQSWTIYDLLAASLDIIVRGDGTASGGKLVPARPSVWGAGNNGFAAPANYDNEEGYYSVFTSAKNTLSVGSIDTEKTPDERLSWFSSCGPTLDGRIKPDLVAPGCRNSISGSGIMAAKSPPGYPGVNNYSGMSGTSMAAPVVSGIIALLMHQYQKTFSIFPNASDPPKLQPATYKAMLIHTARDLIKLAPWPPEFPGTPNEKKVDWENPDTGTAVLYYEGPDFATGYGLVNAEEARSRIAQSSQWGEGTIPSEGSSQSWCIDVPAGATEVKVVLAWDDDAGTGTLPETPPRLVHDLDLVLKAPNGTLHLPWTLTALPLTSIPADGAKDPISPSNVLPAVRAPDHLNNVEMVTVRATAAAPLITGIWKATITGFDLPMGKTQRYGIVSSHPMSQSCPPDTPVPQRDICSIFPRACDPQFLCIPRLKVVRRYFHGSYIQFPVNCPVPIDEICKYVINCPGCDHGSALQLCPGFLMKVQGVPKDAVVIVFNEQGQILDQSSRERKMLTLTVPQHPPGSRQFVLVMPKLVTPERWAGLPEYLKLKFDFK